MLHGMLIALVSGNAVASNWDEQLMENSNLYCPNCHRTTYFFDCRTHLECSRCKKVLIKVIPTTGTDASSSGSRNAF